MAGYHAGDFEVIVVGAGHAGCEAALASARMGRRTLCLTSNLDAIGNLPCNPSIGGTAKGQLAREVDALGGEIARAADAACIQFRMLNRGKGPAVYSPRAQTDRAHYRAYMKHALETCDNLTLLQGECADIITESNVVAGIQTASGARYGCRALVLATGTFLNGRVYIGDWNKTSGPDGLMSCDLLSSSLALHGFKLKRFKTGTPPRIDARTVDFSRLSLQEGEQGGRFSFSGERSPNRAVCYLGYTNERTHAVIREALWRSPLYRGDISGTGPRYCPSIEDKVVRFADKERHQIFLEPCGAGSAELYAQGLSTSLPEDVQRAMVRTVEGLEKAEIMRFGYAIEYDCLDPLCLDHRLAVGAIPGLFAAGQLCGSSGYEEAAGQGLVAGVNAARYVRGEPPFVLTRADGYIGTLIDDLVLKGADEPYRMMTSRCEHRLVCRQDNADARLMERGAQLGLVDEERLAAMREKYARIAREIERLARTFVPPSEPVNAFLERKSSAKIASGASLKELLRRPEIDYQSLQEIDAQPPLSEDEREQVEISVKYEGYIARMTREIEENKKMERYALPEGLDYASLSLLRIEARQKLARVRPETLGQAARISGVSPSDIAALLVILAQRGKNDA